MDKYDSISSYLRHSLFFLKRILYYACMYIIDKANLTVRIIFFLNDHSYPFMYIIFNSQ